MIPRLAILSSVLLPFASSAFQFHLPSAATSTRKFTSQRRVHHHHGIPTRSRQSSLATTINIAEDAPRDVNSIYEWGSNYGVQTAPCFQVSTQDGVDMFAVTTQDLPAESPIVCVPSDLILSGEKARQEFGVEASAAERALKLSDHTAFYLFLKVLQEYELGEQSPWYAWLNSLPRYFTNAAAMTEFCFSCLPPYAKKQAQTEKSRLKRFQLALDNVSFLSEGIRSDEDLTRWAYNVVHTRYHETPGGDYALVPMADYFNHGGTEADAYVTFDQEGSCYAYSTRDVPAGMPLNICYGDPTNPSQLLARYGFLDESSPGTYCKWIAAEPSSEIFDMGYPSKMLFYQDGAISDEVWDVLLYDELGKLAGYDEQAAFYQAHASGDGATKAGYHQQYFPQTLEAVQRHVSYILGELDELSTWQQTKLDTRMNPRLPLIVGHNDFARRTFEMVQRNIDGMRS